MVFSLKITIPKREEQQEPLADEPLEELISQLKYLETPAYRAKMQESDRVEMRANVTRQFRQALAIRTFFTVPKVVRTSSDDFDEIYK